MICHSVNFALFHASRLMGTELEQNLGTPGFSGCSQPDLTDANYGWNLTSTCRSAHDDLHLRRSLVRFPRLARASKFRLMEYAHQSIHLPSSPHKLPQRLPSTCPIPPQIPNSLTPLHPLPLTQTLITHQAITSINPNPPLSNPLVSLLPIARYVVRDERQPIFLYLRCECCVACCWAVGTGEFVVVSLGEERVEGVKEVN